MIEIRFHGRGGFGTVFAGYVLAEAAFIEKKDVQAFPYFGVERRGAPVTAFVRLDSKPIKIRCQIYKPDYVIVLDEMLLEPTPEALLEGLSKDGLVLINTRKSPAAIQLDFKVATVDATAIALKHGLGTKALPTVNTAILGAFVKATGIVKLESLISAIRERIRVKTAENIEAARDAYNAVRLG